MLVALRPPARLASRRARAYWTVRALTGWVVLGAVTTVVLVAAAPPGALAIGAAVAVVALVHILVMPQWRYRVHRWEVGVNAVQTQAGWFTQERRIAPIARIQTVDTERGPFESLFGLANVTITTASARGPLHIKALDRSVADDVVAALTERTQTGDAT